LASAIDAYKRCEKNGNKEWSERHSDTIRKLAREFLPSGSGFDSGTKVDIARSTADVLYLETSYHHMHESGMYDGWTEHTVTVKPSLVFGFTLRINGPDRNGFKDYAYEEFRDALETLVEHTFDGTSDVFKAVIEQ